MIGQQGPNRVRTAILGHRELDAPAVKQLFGAFPSGVALLAADTGTPAPLALVVSTLQVGISMEPPLVTFAVAHRSTTWPALRSAGRIGVSVLAGSHAPVVRRLSSHDPDRFDGLDLAGDGDGALFLEGASVWMSCSVHAEHEAGDHSLVLLEIHGSDIDPSSAPLVYQGSRFHALGELGDE